MRLAHTLLLCNVPCCQGVRVAIVGVLPVCDATLDTLLRRSLDVSHEVRGRDVDWLVGGGEAAGADGGQAEGHRGRLVGVETGGGT